MMDDFKKRFKILYEKIKKVKHIEIYLAVGLAVIIAIIYFISLKPASSNSQVTEDDNLSINISSSQEYVANLENKLESVLAKVKGTGEVSVIVTLEKGFEYVYATDEEVRTTSDGTTVTTTNVVMVDGEPILIEEIYPVIGGIVVVAQGADNVSVKMNMISIIQTITNIESSKINIFEGS